MIFFLYLVTFLGIAQKRLNIEPWDQFHWISHTLARFFTYLGHSRFHSWPFIEILVTGDTPKNCKEMSTKIGT